MGLVVGALEAFGGKMSIDLGGREVGVAEEFLHAPKVRAGVEQVRGVTVAQLMWCEARVQRSNGQIFLQAQLQVARGKRAELLYTGDKNGRLAAGRLGEELPVGLDGPQSRFADRKQALFFAFAADAEEAFVPVDILRLQPAQLADAQAAGINGFKDGDVTAAAYDEFGRFLVLVAPRRQQLERSLK